MMIKRDGVVLTTTFAVSAGFVASAWDQQEAYGCIVPAEPCQVRYLPVSPIVPYQPHTETGESSPTMLVISNDLVVSGSNVHAQIMTSASAATWVLESDESTFDLDRYMAERFRQVGINVVVRLYSPKSSDSAALLAAEGDGRPQSSA